MLRFFVSLRLSNDLKNGALRPDDVQVYVEHKKFKADKFILHELINVNNEGNLKNLINIESDFRSADYEYKTVQNINTNYQTQFSILCKQMLSKTFEKVRKQRFEQQKQQFEQQKQQFKQREQWLEQRKRRLEQYKQHNSNDEKWPTPDGWSDI